uniref:Avh232 n=1 Tax=Phytophthora sojae TaxID=67593 RepID=G1FSA2_PHYSO|nr:Avh232 [Phytophthora sojae]
MRTQCIVLLVLILCYAGTNTAEALPHADKVEISSMPNRHLRSHEPVADEERGGHGLWVSRLAELDQSLWKLQKLGMAGGVKVWLHFGKDPVYMFNYMHKFNTWQKVGYSKRALIWFRFTKAFRTKNGAGSFTDYQIYKLLSREVPDEKLALVFESLKQIDDLKSLGETMQKYQFMLWIDDGASPASIRKLLGMRPSSAVTSERGPRDDIIDAFTKLYNN